MQAFVDVLDRHGAVVRVYPVTPGVPEDDAIAEARARATADRLAPAVALADLRYAYRIDSKTWEVPKGVAAVNDGFGGRSAWLTVRESGRTAAQSANRKEAP